MAGVKRVLKVEIASDDMMFTPSFKKIHHCFKNCYGTYTNDVFLSFKRKTG
jgi:hypothetical protein